VETDPKESKGENLCRGEDGAIGKHGFHRRGKVPHITGTNGKIKRQK